MCSPTVRIGNKPYHCNKGILEQSRVNGLKFMLVKIQMLSFLLLFFFFLSYHLVVTLDNLISVGHNGFFSS